jgi:hypothetical protein
MSDTIDITILVENMRSTFVTMALKLIYTQAATVPWLLWINTPIIHSMVDKFLNWVLDAITQWEVMQAFFLNTAIRKSLQSKDYTEAILYKNNLPTNATAEQFKKAEQYEIDTFNNFVRFSN